MSPAREKSWDEFAESIRKLESTLSQSDAKTVRSPEVRDTARSLAQLYFRETRLHLQDLRFSEEVLAEVDAPAKVLLDLSHAQSERAAYFTALASIRKSQGELSPEREIRMGSGPGVLGSGTVVATHTERLIIDTLADLVPSASQSYEQALVDLDAPMRRSYRGVAHEMREALRETLDHFAPDAAVMAEKGFKLEKGLTRPTQRQKALHILKKRKLSADAIKAPEQAVSMVDELGAAIARSTYRRGNMSAHGAGTGQEVRQLKMYIDAVLAELLEVHRDS